MLLETLQLTNAFAGGRRLGVPSCMEAAENPKQGVMKYFKFLLIHRRFYFLAQKMVQRCFL